MNRKRVVLWSAVCIALAAVFTAYVQPELAFTLANQLWNCF